MRKLARYSGFRCRNLPTGTPKIGCCIKGSDDLYYIGVNHKLNFGSLSRIVTAEESALMLFLNAADRHVKIRSVFMSYDPDASSPPMQSTCLFFNDFLESPSTRVFVDNGKQVVKYQFDEWK